MGDQQSVDQLTSFFHAATWDISCSVIMPIRLPAICDYHQTRSPLEKGLLAGIISHGLSCRCSELCLFEALHPAPLARPFSKGLLAGIISHRLSCRCDELCLFEALHPAPLARPFSKGLLAGDYLTWAFIRYGGLCLFEVLYPAPW